MDKKGISHHCGIAAIFSGFLLLSGTGILYAEKVDPNTESSERILHFSTAYSIGRIDLQNESKPHKYEGIKFWSDPDWQYTARARGDVIIPPGHRVKLILTEQIWEDRERAKDLTKLAPDAVYALELWPQQHPAPSDWLVTYLSHLTGLKELKLGTVKLSSNALQSLKQCTGLQLLYAPEGLTNAGLKEITQIQTLKTLIVPDSQLTDKVLILLKDMPQLEELIITGGKFTDEALPYIAALPKLKHLYLDGNFSNGAMARLKKCSSLKILGIKIGALDDRGLRHISEIPNLEGLDAYWVEGIMDEGIGYLKKNMPKLKMLDVKHAKLTDRALSILSTMPSLEYLCLPGSGLTDLGVEKLSQLKELKFLWVSTSSNSVLTDRSMRAICLLPQLEELHVCGKGITDEGVKCLVTLKQLQSLSLGCISLNNQGLETISTLKNLERLSIDYPEKPVTTNGLNQLNRLTNLKSLSCHKARKGTETLNLSGLKNLKHLSLGMDQDFKQKDKRAAYYSLLGDEDVKCFENMNQLNNLILVGLQITNEGFKTIAALPKLTVIQLFGPTRMTDHAFTAFSTSSEIGGIRLDGGHFTGTCLEHLAKIENLKNLELTSDVAFDKKSVYEFKQKKKWCNLELKP